MTKHPAKPDLPPVLIVHWLDAAGQENEIGHEDSADCVEQYSVGFLRRVKPSHVTLYQTDEPTQHHRFDHLISIPMGCVIRWCVLGRKGRWCHADDLTALAASHLP